MTIENLIETLSADLESVALLKNRKTEKNIYWYTCHSTLQ